MLNPGLTFRLNIKLLYSGKRNTKANTKYSKFGQKNPKLFKLKKINLKDVI